MAATQPSVLEESAQAYLWDLAERAEPDALRRIRRACEEEQLPAVSPETGRLLQVLAAMTGARRVLEVGTLYGYSAAWLARALPEDGRVDTIEMDPDTADRAEAFLADAGVGERVRVHRGTALDVLPTLEGPYDMVFLDADKREYVDYLEHAKRVLRPGGVVAADNVLWSGRVYDDAVQDDDTVGLRWFTEAVTANEAFVTSVLPVGDGLSVSVYRP